MKPVTLVLLSILLSSIYAGNPGPSATVATPASTYTVNWVSTSFNAIDVGVGAEGDFYTVGTDGRLYGYNFLINTYTQIVADFDLNTITRVDVDADGTPYVVAGCFGIYYLNCHNIWVKLPGCANDIGVGRGGEVWKIGCDTRAGGFGIWKLFCKCKCKGGCERKCLRFRPNKYSTNKTGDVRKCFWYRVEGGAKRIDVGIDGNPIVATDAGAVFRYDGINYIYISGILARDVSVSNEGLLFAAGINTTIYRLVNEANGIWATLSGAALEVTAGPYSQPWAVATNNIVYTAAKIGTN